MLRTLFALGGLSLLLCATPSKASTTAGELAENCSHRAGDPESFVLRVGTVYSSLAYQDHPSNGLTANTQKGRKQTPAR
jgi:hypothetical protein